MNFPPNTNTQTHTEILIHSLSDHTYPEIGLNKTVQYTSVYNIPTHQQTNQLSIATQVHFSTTHYGSRMPGNEEYKTTHTTRDKITCIVYNLMIFKELFDFLDSEI